MSYYSTCHSCGAHLDPGEVCDCGKESKDEMSQRESQVAEFAELLKKADAEQITWIKKCMLLFINSSGFNAAFEEATPPGKECPPADVVKALVNEWARKEGLE